MALRVLILGGYGMFGGRLARLPDAESRLTLIVAGRSLTASRDLLRRTYRRARRLCRRRSTARAISPRNCRALTPDIVVDASGPFQGYADPYRLVRAAIAYGLHYLDLADGSDFVNGIAQFDAAARERGVFVLSGRIELSGADRGGDARLSP